LILHIPKRESAKVGQWPKQSTTMAARTSLLTLPFLFPVMLAAPSKDCPVMEDYNGKEYPP